MRKTLIAGIGCLFLAGGAYLVYQRSGPKPEPPVELSQLDPLLQEAIRKELSTAASDRRSPLAWLRVGLLYEANALFGDAARCYTRLLERWPEDGRALYQLACVQERSGDLVLAKGTMEEATKAAPEYYGAWSRLALWALDLGELALAEKAVGEAKRLNPEDVTQELLSVQLLLAQLEGKKALALCEAEGFLERGGEYVYHLLSQARRQTGDLIGAEEAHRRGAGSRLRFSDPWTEEMMRFQTGYAAMERIAGRHIKAGRFARARELLERVTAFDDGEPRSLNMLAVCWIEEGDYARALSLLEQVFAIDPSHHDGSLNFARCILASGTESGERLDGAIERVEAAMEKRPNEAFGWQLLASLAEKRGEQGKLLSSLDRLVALQPDATLARLKAAYAALKLERFDDALARFEALEAEKQEESEVLFGKLTTLVLAGRKPEAEKALAALEHHKGLDEARLAKLSLAVASMP